jgi:hypothetical protein
MPFLHARRVPAENVHSGISVRVGCETTMATEEDRLALTARFVDDSATGTRLRRVGWIDLDNAPAALFDLVRQKPFKCAPGLVRDRTVDASLASTRGRHVRNTQTLDDDYPVRARNAGRRLVVPVQTHPRDLRRNPPKPIPSLLTAMRSSHSATKHPAGLFFLARKEIEVREGEQFTARKSDGVRHPTVNADDSRGRGVLRLLYLDSERDMPPKGVEGEGDGLDFTGQRTSVSIAKPADLRQSHLTPSGRNRTRLAVPTTEPDRVLFASPPILRITRSSAKEEIEGPIQVMESGLLAASRHITNPVDLGAKLGQFPALLKEVQGDAVVPVVRPHLVAVFERQIVDEPAHTREAQELLFLIRRRVEAIAVAAVHKTILASSDGRATVAALLSQPEPKGDKPQKETL